MVQAKIKTLPDANGVFTIDVDGVTHSGVVPVNMESEVDKAILSFSRGVVKQTLASRSLASSTYKVNDVVYEE